eukprot:c11653_g1_i1.p1 GENE.c11653_g1_i1~~c11653_g1_i1.p1  ORF type:complete len:972 (+),score=236.18 c11653_g1_i1:47-2917(+)
MKGEAPPQFHLPQPDDQVVYVGNLPFKLADADKAEISRTLQQFGPASILFRSRGFAWVLYEDAHAAQAAVASLTSWTFGGRLVRVELKGECPTLQLRRVCQEANISYPLFQEVGGNKYHLSAVLDHAAVAPDTQSTTVKEARRMAAASCLEFIRQICRSDAPSTAPLPSPPTPPPSSDSDDYQPRLPLVPVQADQPSSAHIRNMCVIAHIDAGKTTLVDCLLAAAGKLNNTRAGDARALDVGEGARRGITITSTAVTLTFPRQECPLVVNLIDSPGHMDFTGEVTAALRMVDGALVVVDACEGVRVQTETVLRQAIGEKVALVLVLNKVDRLISELKFTPLQVAERLFAIVAQVNGLIADFSDADASCPSVSFENNSVVFGSAYYGWMANLHSIAASFFRSQTAEAKQQYLKALTHNLNPARFAKNALAPIFKLHELSTQNDHAGVKAMLSKIGAGGVSEDLTGRDFVRACMRSLLPPHAALLHSVEMCLPSPLTAQRYKVSVVCPDAESSVASRAIANCDPNGPFTMFVSKLLRVPKSKGMAAVGRVLSGTIRAGGEVFVWCSSQRGDEGVWRRGKVQRVLALDGHSFSSIEAASAGSLCGLIGLDKLLLKSGTVASEPLSCPLATLRFSLTPVIECALSAKAATGDAQAKLKDACTELSKTDPCFQTRLDAVTKQRIIACTGPLHMEVSVAELQRLVPSIELVVSEAIVVHREGIQSSTPTPVAIKTPNGHNKFWFTASPLTPDLVAALEAGKEFASEAQRVEFLATECGWERAHAKKVIVFGGCEAGPNVLVDSTVSVQHMSEVRDHLISAFLELCASGPLRGQGMRGVRIDIVEARLHNETAMRRAVQVVPACAKGMREAVQSASPFLFEPVHSVQVFVPFAFLSDVYACLSRARGELVGSDARSRGLYEVQGKIPIVETPAFTQSLKEQTRGTAFALYVFDSWRPVPTPSD